MTALIKESNFSSLFQLSCGQWSTLTILWWRFHDDIAYLILSCPCTLRQRLTFKFDIRRMPWMEYLWLANLSLEKTPELLDEQFSRMFSLLCPIRFVLWSSTDVLYDFVINCSTSQHLTSYSYWWIVSLGLLHHSFSAYDARVLLSGFPQCMRELWLQGYHLYLQRCMFYNLSLHTIQIWRLYAFMRSRIIPLILRRVVDDGKSLMKSRNERDFLLVLCCLSHSNVIWMARCTPEWIPLASVASINCAQHHDYI